MRYFSSQHFVVEDDLTVSVDLISNDFGSLIGYANKIT